MARSRWSSRMIIILLTGFLSGLPLGLTGSTLQAWMKGEGVDLTLIGIFTLVGMPYSLKFLWAPLMDRYLPPFLGRRRGWMFVTQAALAISIALMAFSDPLLNPGFLAAIAFGVAFFSASQDIVIDAYRTEYLRPDELGLGAGTHVMGYRIAMLTSGALALILADQLPWRAVYLLMAACMAAGMLVSFFAPEPEVPARSPRTLKEAVLSPLLEFFSRKGSLEVLAFITLYKLDAIFASALTTPFLLDLGFTKTDIGTINKGLGFFATIGGTLLGGAWMMKLGMERSLWIFGILQGASNLTFMVLARMGNHYPTLVAAIGLENLTSGMGSAAYAGFIMSLCDKRFTATQYALLTSLMALTRVIGGSPTGYLAKALGWEHFFLVSTFLAIPSLLLLLRFKRWNTTQHA